MAYEVVMPRLGWNMETGALSTWRKREGDFVSAGEILFEVESEKAIQEVESLENGVLRIPPGSPGPGEVVPVGTLLAYLLQPGEALPTPTPASPLASSPAVAPTHPPASAQAQLGRTGTAAISPRARRVAAELGIPWTGLTGSGRTGRIVERDVRQAARTEAIIPAPTPADAARIQASPLALRLAQELGFDLAPLAARLPGKRIERADVEAAIRAALQQAAQAPAPGAPAGAIRPISPMRRLTAERMAASAHTAAPVTLTSEADATELVQLRRQLKEDGAQLPTYTDLLVTLTAQALGEHPELNARFENGSILQLAEINIGIAVDSGAGLLVPVLAGVQAKSLRQVARESAELVEKARQGRLKTAEMSGGTFTITNLGMYDIDTFTPIINLPECAILGVGRIVPRQVVLDADAGKVAIRQMVFLSLTFDHRLVDGAPAARFLQRVKQLVEKPYIWLVR